MQGVEVHIEVDEKVKPKFHKPMTVPFIIREKIESELDRLQRLGIISKRPSGQPLLYLS